MTWEEILLSREAVELFPGVHWESVESQVLPEGWVDLQGFDFDPLEGPPPNFASAPLEAWQKLGWAVDNGWAQVALRLNALAAMLGGKGACAWAEGGRYFYKFQEAPQ